MIAFSFAVGFHGGLIMKSFRGSQLPKALDSLSANHHARFSKEPCGAEAGASMAAKETVVLALVYIGRPLAEESEVVNFRAPEFFFKSQAIYMGVKYRK